MLDILLSYSRQKVIICKTYIIYINDNNLTEGHIYFNLLPKIVQAPPILLLE